MDNSHLVSNLKIRISFSAVAAKCASLYRFDHPIIARKYKSRLQEMSRAVGNGWELHRAGQKAAKAATDTFFHRSEDALSALLVLICAFFLLSILLISASSPKSMLPLPLFSFYWEFQSPESISDILIVELNQKINHWLKILGHRINHCCPEHEI